MKIKLEAYLNLRFRSWKALKWKSTSNTIIIIIIIIIIITISIIIIIILLLDYGNLLPMRSKDNLLLILGNDFEHENKTRDIPELLKLKKLPPDKNIRTNIAQILQKPS